MNLLQSSELHTIGNIGECERGELIHNLMGAEVEGLTLEGLHLKVLQDEVVRGVALVDGIFH